MNDFDSRLDDFGRQLAVAAREPASARSRLRALAPVTLGGAVVAGAVTVLLLGLGGAGKRLSFTAQARAALAPEGKIVHAVLRSSLVRQPGYTGHLPGGQRTETWSAADPPRWRFVTRSSGYGPRRTISGRSESSYAAGVARSYFAPCDQMTVTRGFDADDHVEQLPTPLGVDPIRQLSSMLINRRLHDAGTVQLPTGTAHRLVGVVSRKPILRRLTYLIDEDTYRPIRVTFQMWFVGGPRAQRTVVRYDVLRYERLVESAATSRLLRIETTARTRKLFLNGDPHTIAEKKRMSERVTRFYRDCGTRP